MSETLPNHDSEVWERFVESYSTFLAASRELYADGVDRVTLIREALRTGRQKFAACHVLGHLKPAELQQLFDLLVEWASTGHGLVQFFHKAILSLPRDWVLDRIEVAAEPLLRDGTYDEFRRFLELYVELDRDLTARLAHRAAEHHDEDIREAGEDYLELLMRTNPEGQVAVLTPVAASSLKDDAIHQRKIG